MPISLPPAAPCPCGSQHTYKACCQPYHKNKKPPPTPETLMRARYTAYAAGDVAFIMRTTHPESPYYKPDKKAWRKELRAFCHDTRFLGLDVLGSEMADDGKTGHVSFRALLMQDGKNASFTERSRFEQVKGRWLYVLAAP